MAHRRSSTACYGTIGTENSRRPRIGSIASVEQEVGGYYYAAKDRIATETTRLWRHGRRSDPEKAPPPPPPQPSALAKYGQLAIFFVLHQWFLIGMFIGLAIASQVQVPMKYQAVKQEVINYVSVSITFFVAGCTIPTRALIDNLIKWKNHIFVMGQCFVMTSITAFGIVSAFATQEDVMDPWLLLGLLVVGSVPTTFSCNVVLTRKAHGNTAFTVAQATLGNLVAPFISPLLLSAYTSTGAWYSSQVPRAVGDYGDIYRRVFKQLGLSIILPVFMGQVVQNVAPRPTYKVFVEWKMNKIGPAALLALIWQTFDTAFATGAFQSLRTRSILLLIFISIALWIFWASIAFWTGLAWLSREDAVAALYVVAGKGTSFGVPFVSVLYIGFSPIQMAKIQIPIVIYQVFHIAFGSLLTLGLRRWIPKYQQKHSEPEMDVE